MSVPTRTMGIPMCPYIQLMYRRSIRHELRPAPEAPVARRPRSRLVQLEPNHLAPRVDMLRSCDDEAAKRAATRLSRSLCCVEPAAKAPQPPSEFPVPVVALIGVAIPR